MGYWKANKLQCRADIAQRGLFRFLWCTVPYLVFALYRFLMIGDPRLFNPLPVLLVLGIPIAGMVVDSSILGPDAK